MLRRQGTGGMYSSNHSWQHSAKTDTASILGAELSLTRYCRLISITAFQARLVNER
jgi:hypothetical protein